MERWLEDEELVIGDLWDVEVLLPDLGQRPKWLPSEVGALFDPGPVLPQAEDQRLSTEGGQHALGDGVWAGWGYVAGQPCMAYAINGSHMGGSLGRMGCERIARAIAVAVERSWPLVGFWHSGGARLQEGVESLDGVGAVFSAIVQASGLVPQISVIVGPCAGGAAYGPALTDVVIMTRDSRMFVTGPKVVAMATGERPSAEDLGGWEVHARRSGVAHLVCDDRMAAVRQVRSLLSTLWPVAPVDPSRAHHVLDLDDVLPSNPRQAYDVRVVVGALLDGGSFIELQAEWGSSVFTGLGKLAGGTVGVIANNPQFLAGCLTADASDKAGRFVRMCDSFGVPLVVLVDVPGFLPGTEQESGGIVRRGAKLLHAFARAKVPRVTIVLRKAIGGAYISMNSRALGATAIYAWPGADVAIMSAESAVEVMNGRRLREEGNGTEADFVDVYRRQVVEAAARAGALDRMIAPHETKRMLALEIWAAGRRRGEPANAPT